MTSRTKICCATVTPRAKAILSGGRAGRRWAQATGLCGALTTYSTFGYETIRLLEDRARAYAVLNAVASVVAGLGAAFCGIAVADAIWH